MVVLDRQCGQKRILLVRTAKLLLKMEGRHTWHGVECAALLCLPYHACLPALAHGVDKSANMELNINGGKDGFEDIIIPRRGWACLYMKVRAPSNHSSNPSSHPSGLLRLWRERHLSSPLGLPCLWRLEYLFLELRTTTLHHFPTSARDYQLHNASGEYSVIVSPYGRILEHLVKASTFSCLNREDVQ